MDPANVGLVYPPEKFIFRLYKKLLHVRRKRALELNSLSDRFGDIESIARYYVPPDCQTSNPADLNTYNPTLEVRSPVFQTINAFLKGTFPNQADGRNCLFVLADAGMGKTSLLVMLKLLHLTNFWPRGYNCECLKIEGNLAAELDKIQRKAQTVLLLDALDEDKNASEDFLGRLREIQTATETFLRIIVTCRTQFFPKYNSSPIKRNRFIQVNGYSSPLVYLSYFNEQQVSKYLYGLFGGNIRQFISPRRRKMHLRAKLIISRMGTLSLRPLLLSHIEDFLQYETTEWTEVKIYEALIEVWLLREIRKLYKLKKRTIEFEQLKSACVNVALEMQRNHSRLMSSDQLNDIAKFDSGVADLGTLELGGRSLLSRTSAGEYRFSHYSIQEFLVASALNHSWEIGGKTGIWLTNRILHFSKLLGADEATNSYNNRDFSGCIFSGCNIAGFDFHGCNFRGAQFKDMELNDVGFYDADLTKSVFVSCAIVATRFQHSKIDYTEFKDSHFVSSQFSNCELKNVGIIGGEINLCSLGNSNLSGCGISKSKIKYCNFESVDFTGCRIEQTTVELGSFRDCNFSHAFLGFIIASRVKENSLVPLEAILSLEARYLEKLLRDVDISKIAIACKSLPKHSIFALKKGLTTRNFEAIKEEFEFCGPMRPADVEEAQFQIMDVYRRMEANDEIGDSRSRLTATTFHGGGFDRVVIPEYSNTRDFLS